MAPSQLQLLPKGTKKRVGNPMDHPVAKIVKGAAAFSDKHVD